MSLDQYTEAYQNDLEDDARDGMSLYALFVLETSISSTVRRVESLLSKVVFKMLTDTQTINKVVKDAFREIQFDYLWLADDYDRIDVHCGDDPGLLDRNGVCTVISDDWATPFAGKTIQEAAAFVRNAPKPPKALNKVFFVILDKELYETHEWLTVCKIVEGEVQTVPCAAHNVSHFLVGHDRDTWQESLEDWQGHGVPAVDNP